MGILNDKLEPILKERHAKYGSPLANMTLTANFWTLILGTEVSPHHVVQCMIALKLARELARHSEDNILDIAGYCDVDLTQREEVARQKQEQT